MSARSVLELRPLTEQTYDWIKERIFTGRFKPGERISIDDVARALGVSRTPVRDAIHRLAFEGLTVVSARRSSAIARLSNAALADVYAARRIVEPAIAAAATRLAKASDLGALERIQREWGTLDPSAIYHSFAAHSRYSELDVRFHQRIAATLANERIDRLIRELAVQRQVAPRLFGSGYDGPARRIAEHRAILDAIASRDPARASDAMRAHIENSERELLAYLEHEGAQSDATTGTARSVRRRSLRNTSSRRR